MSQDGQTGGDLGEPFALIPPSAQTAGPARRRRGPGPVRVLPATTTTFERAWAAFPESGRRRSSRLQAWPAWRRVVGEIGEDALAAAASRYAAEDAEHRRECGAPGFHRWLAWGRWEAWLGAPEPAIARADPSASPRFPISRLRAAFHVRFADEDARAWFDRCAWDTHACEIVSPLPLKPQWADGPFAAWMRLNGVKRWRLKAP